MTSLSSHFTNLAFKIPHFVELNKSYYPAEFHWPKLSGSNSTRGWKTPHSDLHAFKKPSPYRASIAVMVIKCKLDAMNII